MIIFYLCIQIVSCYMLSDFIPSKSTPPSPRISPSLAYSELWDSLIVFGGNDLLNRYHDI